jgi:uncharacterized protein (DUF433 family)
MGGVPCIVGTRIPVATLVSMIAEGMTTNEIVTDFPQINRDDIRQGLQFAAETMREREMPLRASALDSSSTNAYIHAWRPC